MIKRKYKYFEHNDTSSKYLNLRYLLIRQNQNCRVQNPPSGVLSIIVNLG